MPSEPSSAEQARTLLASARVATLTTYPARPPRPPRTTLAAVEADPCGRPVVRLQVGASAVADLTARPLATVTVAPPQSEAALVIHGAARLLSGMGGPGLLAYRVDAGCVRLAAGTSERVDVDAYATAEPDPLSGLAARVLSHLGKNHALDLAGCLRAHGASGVQWAHPRRLDRYGLELLAVDDHGVSRVRLPFPRPLTDVTDLDPGLHAILCCRCRRSPSSQP